MPQPAVPVVIDTAKKSLLVGGAEVTLSAKEWLLLELVYKHRNEVSHLRLHPHDGLGRTRLLRRQAPEVGVEEINLLLYRLRRKLGAGANISSKPAAAGAASWKSARRQYCFRRLSLL